MIKTVVDTTIRINTTNDGNWYADGTTFSKQ